MIKTKIEFKKPLTNKTTTLSALLLGANWNKRKRKR